MRRLSGRLYFFPVFLPLAEMLPWVLSLLGLVTGVAGFSLRAFLNKHGRRIFITVTVLCLVGAGSVYVLHRPDKVVVVEGSRFIDPVDYAAPVTHRAAPETQKRDFQSFDEIWSKPTEKRILSTPVIVDDLLLFGSLEGSVEAVSLQDGDAVWSLPRKVMVFTLTSDGKGIVYAGEGMHETQAASLTAIEAQSGEILWQREFLGHLEETIALNDDGSRIWLSTGPGGLWAVNAHSGSVFWKQALGHIDSRPLLAEGMIYVPAQADEKVQKTAFYALEADRGKVSWSLPLPGQPWGSPIMDKTGEIILTSTGIGQIGVKKETDKGWAQALSRQGRLLWQVDLPDMSLQPMAYVSEGDIVVHTTKKGDIIALHVKDGSVAWGARAADEFRAPATLITGYTVPMLASVSYDGIFSIRNALTGEELARRVVAKNATASPVVDGDIIYVAGDRIVQAFGGLHTLVPAQP